MCNCTGITESTECLVTLRKFISSDSSKQMHLYTDVYNAPKARIQIPMYTLFFYCLLKLAIATKLVQRGSIYNEKLNIANELSILKKAN